MFVLSRGGVFLASRPRNKIVVRLPFTLRMVFVNEARERQTGRYAPGYAVQRIL